MLYFDEKSTRKLIENYKARPRAFSQAQINAIQQHANAYKIPFAVDEQTWSDYVGGVVNQTVSGYISGLTTFNVGEEPQTAYERIARATGSLAGFVSFIPAGPFKLLKMPLLAKAAKAASGKASVPMVVANYVTKKAEGALGTAMSYLSGAGVATSAIRALQNQAVKFIAKRGFHLGAASAVSSWQGGVDDMMKSFVHGAAFGAASQGAAGMFNMPDSPAAQKLARALAGSLMDGLPTSLQGATTPEQIYYYLRGAYFGYKDVSWQEYNANEHLQKFAKERIASSKYKEQNPMNKVVEQLFDKHAWKYDPSNLSVQQAIRDAFSHYIDLTNSQYAKMREEMDKVPAPTDDSPEAMHQYAKKIEQVVDTLAAKGGVAKQEFVNDTPAERKRKEYAEINAGTKPTSKASSKEDDVNIVSGINDADISNGQTTHFAPYVQQRVTRKVVGQSSRDAINTWFAAANIGLPKIGSQMQMSGPSNVSQIDGGTIPTYVPVDLSIRRIVSEHMKPLYENADQEVATRDRDAIMSGMTDIYNKAVAEATAQKASGGNFVMNTKLAMETSIKDRFYSGDDVEVPVELQNAITRLAHSAARQYFTKSYYTRIFIGQRGSSHKLLSNSEANTKVAGKLVSLFHSGTPHQIRGINVSQMKSVPIFNGKQTIEVTAMDIMLGNKQPFSSFGRAADKALNTAQGHLVASLQEALQYDGLYYYGGAANNNYLELVPLHEQVAKSSDIELSAIGDYYLKMFQASTTFNPDKLSYDEFKKEFNALYGINSSSLVKSAYSAKDMLRITISNMLYKSQESIGKPDVKAYIEYMDKNPRDVKTAKDFIKRQQLFASTGDSLNGMPFTSSAMINNKMRLIVAENEYGNLADVPAGGETHKTETADDGAVHMPWSLSSDIARNLGHDTDSGYAKVAGTAFTKDGEAIVLKCALHSHPTKAANDVLENAGVVVARTTAAKMSGNVKVMPLDEYNAFMRGEQVDITPYVNEVSIDGLFYNAGKHFSLNKVSGRHVFAKQISGLVSYESVEASLGSDVAETFVREMENMNSYLTRTAAAKNAAVDEEISNILLNGKTDAKSEAYIKEHFDEIAPQTILNAFEKASPEMKSNIIRRIVDPTGASELANRIVESLHADTEEVADDTNSIEEFEAAASDAQRQLSELQTLVAKLDFADAALYNPHARRQITSMLKSLIMQPYLRPKVHNSAELVLAPVTGETLKGTRMEAMLHDDTLFFVDKDVGAMPIKLRNGITKTLREIWKEKIDIDRHNEEMDKEEAWAAAYGKKFTGEKKQLDEELQEALRFVVTRVPIASLHGTFTMKFGGFSESRGGRIYVNAGRFMQAGGADVDIDTLRIYGGTRQSIQEDGEWYDSGYGLTKEFKDMYEKVSALAFQDVNNNGFNERKRIDTMAAKDSDGNAYLDRFLLSDGTGKQRNSPMGMFVPTIRELVHSSNNTGMYTVARVANAITYINEAADYIRTMGAGKIDETVVDPKTGTEQVITYRLRSSQDLKEALDAAGVALNLAVDIAKFDGMMPVEDIVSYLYNKAFVVTMRSNPIAHAAGRGDYGYEVSSLNDKRLSALYAKVGGRTIEEIYQVDVKGYESVNDGKGKKPKDTSIDTYAEYKKLWQQWAEEPDNLEYLRRLYGQMGKYKFTLRDSTAKTTTNQARALAEIMNEKFGTEVQADPEYANTLFTKFAKLNNLLSPKSMRAGRHVSQDEYTESMRELAPYYYGRSTRLAQVANALKDARWHIPVVDNSNVLRIVNMYAAYRGWLATAHQTKKQLTSGDPIYNETTVADVFHRTTMSAHGSWLVHTYIDSEMYIPSVRQSIVDGTYRNGSYDSNNVLDVNTIEQLVKDGFVRANAQKKGEYSRRERFAIVERMRANAEKYILEDMHTMATALIVRSSMVKRTGPELARLAQYIKDIYDEMAIQRRMAEESAKTKGDKLSTEEQHHSLDELYREIRGRLIAKQFSAEELELFDIMLLSNAQYGYRQEIESDARAKAAKEPTKSHKYSNIISDMLGFGLEMNIPEEPMMATRATNMAAVLVSMPKESIQRFYNAVDLLMSDYAFGNTNAESISMISEYSSPAMYGKLMDVMVRIREGALKALGSETIEVIEERVVKALPEAIDEPKAVVQSIVEASKPVVEAKPVVDNSKRIVFSGGADGADTAFGDAGARLGMTVKHFYGVGHKSPKGNVELTEAQLKEADVHLVQANKTMKRVFPTKSDKTNSLLRRNYYQVKDSEAIIAVVEGITDGVVDGGTGWAVHMAIDMGKPVYVFSQRTSTWYKYDNGWQRMNIGDLPPMFNEFTGIGTRKLNARGKEEIDRYMSQYAAKTKTDPVAQQAVKPVVVDTLTMPEFNAKLAESKDFVNTLRQPYTNKYYGNPFSGSDRGKGTIPMATVKDAVDAYIAWIKNPKQTFIDMHGKEHVVDTERGMWIREQILSGKLDGKTFIYVKPKSVENGQYYSHADALADLVANKHLLAEKPVKPTKVTTQEHISLTDVRSNIGHKIYIFGDNVDRSGYGGQAKEMRGEPNAFGIVTKWLPSNKPKAFFSDADFEKVLPIIIVDLKAIEQAAIGKDIVLPANGIGTGLSQLRERAPRIWSIVDDAIISIKNGTLSEYIKKLQYMAPNNVVVESELPALVVGQPRQNKPQIEPNSEPKKVVVSPNMNNEQVAQASKQQARLLRETGSELIKLMRKDGRVLRIIDAGLDKRIQQYANGIIPTEFAKGFAEAAKDDIEMQERYNEVRAEAERMRNNLLDSKATNYELMNGLVRGVTGESMGNASGFDINALSFEDIKAVNRYFEVMRDPHFLIKYFTKENEPEELKAVMTMMFPEDMSREMMRTMVSFGRTTGFWKNKYGRTMEGVVLKPTAAIERVATFLYDGSMQAHKVTEEFLDEFRRDLLPYKSIEHFDDIFKAVVNFRERKSIVKEIQASNLPSAIKNEMLKMHETELREAIKRYSQIRRDMPTVTVKKGDNTIHQMTIDAVARGINDVITKQITRSLKMVTANQAEIDKLTLKDANGKTRYWKVLDKDQLTKIPMIDPLKFQRQMEVYRGDTGRWIESLGVNGLRQIYHSLAMHEMFVRPNGEIVVPRELRTVYKDHVAAFNAIDRKAEDPNFYFPHRWDSPTVKMNIDNILKHMDRNSDPRIVATIVEAITRNKGKITDLGQLSKMGEWSNLMHAVDRMNSSGEYGGETSINIQRLHGNYASREEADRTFLGLGYEKSDIAMEEYAGDLIKTYYTDMAHVLSRIEINKTRKVYSMLMGKEQAQRWTDFIHLYAQGAAGYGVEIPKELLDDPKMHLKNTLYDMYSDSRIMKFVNNLTRKLFPNETPFFDVESLSVKLKEKGLALDVQTLHKLSSLEGAYEMATLLARPKALIANLLGGTSNTIISVGPHWFKESRKIKNWTAVNRQWDNIEKVTRSFIDWGFVEDYMLADINLAKYTKQGKYAAFIADAVALIKKDNNVSDMTFKDLLKAHKITDSLFEKAAWFMRSSERILRLNAAMAHYMKAIADLYPLADFNETASKVKFDSPVLLDIAKRGVKATQFLYTSQYKPMFANSALGKIMTRFQMYALNSVQFRKQILEDADYYGFRPGTEQYAKFERMAVVDAFSLGLASAFVYSIFDSNLPQPYDWIQSLANWLFGDDGEKDRAFFGAYPYAIAPIQVLSPPALRLVGPTMSAMIDNDFKRLADYNIWTMFPFGTFMTDMKAAIKHPDQAIDKLTGLPYYKFGKMMERKRNIITGEFKSVEAIDEEEKKESSQPKAGVSLK